MTISILEEMIHICPKIELIITTTRSSAMEILNIRNDIECVFVDWSLWSETTQWIIDMIRKTQSKIHKIYATSSNPEDQIQQVLKEWADDIHDKQKILRSLMNIYEIIY